MVTAVEREKRTAYMRKWRAANRDKFNRQARESQRRNKHKHVERNRAAHLRRKYGISQADYDRMLATQGGGCGICKKTTPSSGKHFHVDHDHNSGEVRGLLCGPCNGSLGWLERHGHAANKYLERANG